MSDKKLILTHPPDLELDTNGYGEFPNSYIVTEKGLRRIKKYLKECDNEQNTKI